MMIASTDFVKPNVAGDKNCAECAKTEPAMPAKNAEITNARTFTFVVLIPIDCAAISSSRTDKNARP